MVAKAVLYCTRKCGCEDGVLSASCRLQPHHNGSTSQVPLLERETFSDRPENTSYMYEVFEGQT